MRHKRELLPSENATSWEEFQARSAIEQEECRGATGSWKDTGLIFLSVIPGFGAIAFAYAAAHTSGTTLVMALLIAIICTALFAWPFGAVLRTGLRGARRYLELDHLRAEWQVRTWRGEIPESAPGGPKVWRDEPRDGPEAGATRR
jgi:hypothetical protein